MNGPTWSAGSNRAISSRAPTPEVTTIFLEKWREKQLSADVPFFASCVSAFGTCAWSDYEYCSSAALLLSVRSKTMSPNIRLIIRDVPITLDEATILSAGSFVSVKRLHRTKTGVAKPLPLVEVWCSGSEHVVEQFISHGLSLLSDQGLIDCRVELPINPFNGSAALGRRLAVDIEAFTQRPAITLAPLIGHRDDVPARLERVCAPGVSHVIVCRETEDYHRCAKALVSTDDAVLEIGSCHGNCCAVMLLASLLRLNARLCLQILPLRPPSPYSDQACARDSLLSASLDLSSSGPFARGVWWAWTFPNRSSRPPAHSTRTSVSKSSTHSRAVRQLCCGAMPRSCKLPPPSRVTATVTGDELQVQRRLLLSAQCLWM